MTTDCLHETSLWGRCAACGIALDKHAELREDEYILTDEELRRVAEMPGRWSRPLAGEVLALRARVAKLEERSEKRRVRLAAAEGDLLEVRGALSPNGHPRRIPAEVDIRGSVVPAVDWLLGRVAELEATLEAKRGQHVDTLHYLEQAQRVIERDSAAYGRLLRALWASRRTWQDEAADVAADRGEIVQVALRMQSHIDELQAQKMALGGELLEARGRIAELEARVQHDRA